MNSKDGGIKLAARTLYISQQYTLQEISEKLPVSRQTVARWAKDEKWEILRSSLTMTKEQQLANLYEQIGRLNESISARPTKDRHPTPAEANSICQLTKSIKNLEGDVGINDIIDVGYRFINYLKTEDLELSQVFVQKWDAFLMQQIHS